MDRNYRRIKVLSMGDAQVGKSCLIKRYCESKFVSRYISTIGVDFGVRNVSIDGKDTKVNFWDLSGHPDFFEIRNEFYDNTQGAILVFDCTKRSSFENLEKWTEESTQFGTSTPLVRVLAANKTDNKKSRCVSENEARRWASSNGYEYFETSAKSGKNVNEMFEYIFNSVVRQLPER